MEIGFSLGSNVGDRIAHVSAARREILIYEDTDLLAASPLYETEPIDVRPENQHLDFINSVLIVESEAGPKEWLKRLTRIEQHLGRKRSDDRNGPRTIDVDILFAGDQSVAENDLTIPHPDWAARRFVIAPLADVRPELILPGVGKSVADMLKSLHGGGKVKKLEEPW